MYSLHRARFCAIFGFKFNSFMSSLTYSSHVFLDLPLQPFPSTLTFRQALTHSSPTTCPNKRNRHLLTTSTIHSITISTHKYTIQLITITQQLLFTINISFHP